MTPAAGDHPEDATEPYEACKASIRSQPPDVVLGFTPECMALTVEDRMRAISEVASERGHSDTG